MEGTDLVQILVPKRHLSRVYGFIGSLESGPDPAAAGSEAQQDGTTAADWPKDLIERQYRESPDSMKRFQKWLADHPGEEFTTRQMADALEAERGWNTVAGMLGAYGNRVKNRYRRSSFPFQSRWDYEANQAIHSMTPEVAEIISAL